MLSNNLHRKWLRLLPLLLLGALPALADVPAGYARIHYHRPDGVYQNWGLYTWGASTANNTWCGSEIGQSGTDSFGVYFDVPIDASQNGGSLGFIINDCANGGQKDPGPDQLLDVTQYHEAWVISGNSTVYTTQPSLGSNPIPSGDVRIHYHRDDGNYSGWAIYTWGASTVNNQWCSGEVQQTGTDGFGVYFDIPVNGTQNSGSLGFIINNCSNGGQKDPGANQALQVTSYSEGWVVSGMVTVFIAQPALGANPIPSGDVRIHYHRDDATYTGWALYTWGASTMGNSWCSSEVNITGIDNFGVYFDVSVNAAQNGGSLGFIINNCANGGQKDPGNNQALDVTKYQQGWVKSGDATVYTTAPALPIPAGDVRIHYFRPDGNYSGWALYTWNASTENNTWCASEVQQSGSDAFGIYFDVSVSATQGTPPGDLGFIINNCSQGGTKDPGPDQHLDTTKYNEAWVVSGDTQIFTALPTPGQIASAGLYQRKAFWIDRTTIAIPADDYNSKLTYSLMYSLNAGLTVSDAGVLSGGVAIPLTHVSSGFTSTEAAQYPQLNGYAVFHIANTTSLASLKLALKGQLAVAGVTGTGTLGYVNAVQTAGVLDDLFYYPGALGPVFEHGRLTVSLWAPTAQSVKLLLYTHANDTTPAETHAMTNTNGVWSVEGKQAWRGMYYVYDIVVYAPDSQAVVENLVTDPYSADLSLNGGKTRITDLSDRATKPDDWDETQPPRLDTLSDFSVYELHVREFSVADPSVPEEYRGTYLAFTDRDSYGMRHLRRLADAGLKAVHIMPSMHTASVNEDKSTWKNPGDLSGYPPDSSEQQAAVAAVQNEDGYNFGYDPVHYLAPNGAYAYNPDDRVREYREMVQSLHRTGLRVVQDVVFNHTAAYGQAQFSILDEVVPGYYYRLDLNGNVDTASCCYDTASEHKMFEKLMIDTVVQNAIQYKIDGFRFDDMSLHFVSNMQHIKQALSSLTRERDGVDGSKIYIYGEGWMNPESAALGVNATQANLYGTGIGTFNDRVRDGIRGGSAADATTEQVQGFATGLFTDPSSYTVGLGETADAQKATLLLQADWIRTALAGGLRDFTFEDANGDTVKASQVVYGGQPAGYTASPLESVNYCSVHDNQPLFDAVQMKSAGTDNTATRARRQALAMSIVALGQGVPFFFGADDLLRSKDMDNNSYNSGDWFNKIDWTRQTDNWGIGLPMQSQNEAQWPLMQPLLANTSLKPTSADITYATEAFQSFLRIRESSPLFHMQTLAEVQQNLHFLNTGPSQIPGVIVMKLDANGRDYGPFRHIVVVFNAGLSTVEFQSDQLKGLHLRLHPVQQFSNDSATRSSYANDRTGTLTVSGLTTAVFVGWDR